MFVVGVSQVRLLLKLVLVLRAQMLLLRVLRRGVRHKVEEGREN